MDSYCNNKKSVDFKEYFDWLYFFTNGIANFDNNLYKNGIFDGDEFDAFNIANLESIYRTIENYAEFNDIKPFEDSNVYFTRRNFLVSSNDRVYRIGYVSELDTDFFCSIVVLDNDAPVIDINDVIAFEKDKDERNLDDSNIFIRNVRKRV